MKKLLFAFTAMLALLAFSSCSKDDDNKDDDKDDDKNEIIVTKVSIDASKVAVPNPENPDKPTSTGYWRYYSFSQNKVLGQGLESVEDNAKWAARTDWDVAINTYTIKTNSGTSTTSGGKCGVYTAEGVSFESILTVPANAKFEADVLVTAGGMGGVTTVSKSTSQVIQFKKDADGSLIMPPVYLQSPVYIFKSVGGNKNYKVNFTQYLNADKVAGHVEFDIAEIK